MRPRMRSGWLLRRRPALSLYLWTTAVSATPPVLAGTVRRILAPARPGPGRRAQAPAALFFLLWTTGGPAPPPGPGGTGRPDPGPARPGPRPEGSAFGDDLATL